MLYFQDDWEGVLDLRGDPVSFQDLEFYILYFPRVGMKGVMEVLCQRLEEYCRAGWASPVRSMKSQDCFEVAGFNVLRTAG